MRMRREIRGPRSQAGDDDTELDVYFSSLTTRK